MHLSCTVEQTQFVHELYINQDSSSFFTFKLHQISKIPYNDTLLYEFYAFNTIKNSPRKPQKPQNM